eukprot:gene30830-35867_t
MAFSTLARANRPTFAAAKAVAPRTVRVRAVRPQAAKDAKVDIAAMVRPATILTAANLIMAAPSFAEVGKIFDFNLTGPIMAGQFLLLMVFLEKTWFTPVGKVLDDRDAAIRDKLGSVKDSTGDVDGLAKEAQDILRAARTEVSAMVNEKKNAKQKELDAIYDAAKAKVNAEVESSIAKLEKESAVVLKNLDAQVEKISSEVLARVLPDGVKL